jgi:phosphoenolpyruvate carboxykinase (GTP)
MLPFCGYNMADHWAHWLEMGERLGDQAPAVFQVNWFRTGDDGRFLWPGFSENARVIEWIARRVEGVVGSAGTPIGRLPRIEDLDLDGLDLPAEDVAALFEVDPASWLAECDLTEQFFDRFGSRVPAALRAELASLRYHLRA